MDNNAIGVNIFFLPAPTRDIRLASLTSSQLNELENDLNEEIQQVQQNLTDSQTFIKHVESQKTNSSNIYIFALNQHLTQLRAEEKNIKNDLKKLNSFYSILKKYLPREVKSGSGFSMNSERENFNNIRMVGGRQDLNKIDEVKDDPERLERESFELERRRQQIENIINNRKRIIEEFKESRELKDMGANDTRRHENIKRMKDFVSDELYRIRDIFSNYQQLRPTREELDRLVDLYNDLYNLFPNLMNNGDYIQEYNLEDVINDIHDMNNFWGTQNLVSNRDLVLPRQ